VTSPGPNSFELLQELFQRRFGFGPEDVQPLQGQLGGSGRMIVRLGGGGVTAVGVLHSVREENRAFVEFSKHFRRHGLPVPEIYAEDLARNAYLEEDLGDTTLFEFLNANRSGDSIAPAAVDAYGKTIAVLPRFQVEAGRDLNYKVCYPRDSFDRQSIAWDLNYFKYYFLRLAGVPFNEQALEDDFSRLTRFLLTAPHDFFLYRDFQSRNVMLRSGGSGESGKNGPWFVDYQGGRKGALQYDIASLLFDGKANLPPELREQLLNHYLDCLAVHVAVDRAAFLEHYYAFVYVRILQALGAYGFRGFYERKTHFLESVPYALKNLRWLGANVKLPIALPTLLEALDRIATSEKLAAAAPAAHPLAVRIFSFSYHREMPADPSGHGGGFVFDARSLPNPGREERFRAFNGKDQIVIDYLAAEDSVRQYLEHVFALVDMSVAEYQRRGFENLMVSFGCTGGQHRSVYLAEQLARHLRGRAGVKVEVRHIEQEKIGR
jgi:aminoglycoside/choline kinase family phosphotransferase